MNSSNVNNSDESVVESISKENENNTEDNQEIIIIGTDIVETNEKSSNAECIIPDDEDEDTPIIVETNPDDSSREEIIIEDGDAAEEEHERNEQIESSSVEENPMGTEFVSVPRANIMNGGSNGSTAHHNNDEEEANTFNHYPLELNIKEELDEPLTDNLNSSGREELENDPMDLLEPNNGFHNQSRAYDDYDDDESSASSSALARPASTVQSKIKQWCKEFPWLSCEDENGDGQIDFGYCVYCDSNISLTTKLVRNHNLSLYHKERCENYEAFLEQQQRLGLW